MTEAQNPNADYKLGPMAVDGYVGTFMRMAEPRVLCDWTGGNPKVVDTDVRGFRCGQDCYSVTRGYDDGVKTLKISRLSDAPDSLLEIVVVRELPGALTHEGSILYEMRTRSRVIVGSFLNSRLAALVAREFLEVYQQALIAKAGLTSRP